MEASRLERILLVEDEPDIREIVRLSLEALGGYEMETCDSGFCALNTAPKFCPDLILLDMMMPDMDGATTLQALRENDVTRRTPVIFLTARAQPHEIAHYKSLGALGVIGKPFDALTLAQQIESFWRCHCEAQQMVEHGELAEII